MKGGFESGGAEREQSKLRMRQSLIAACHVLCRGTCEIGLGGVLWFVHFQDYTNWKTKLKQGAN